MPVWDVSLAVVLCQQVTSVSLRVLPFPTFHHSFLWFAYRTLVLQDPVSNTVSFNTDFMLVLLTDAFQHNSSNSTVSAYQSYANAESYAQVGLTQVHLLYPALHLTADLSMMYFLHDLLTLECEHILESFICPFTWLLP